MHHLSSKVKQRLEDTNHDSDIDISEYIDTDNEKENETDSDSDNTNQGSHEHDSASGKDDHELERAWFRETPIPVHHDLFPWPKKLHLADLRRLLMKKHTFLDQVNDKIEAMRHVAIDALCQDNVDIFNRQFVVAVDLTSKNHNV